MNNKEEIKQEIYRLSKKISESSSEVSLLETARELYEKSILLKYADERLPQGIAKQEEISITEEPAQLQSSPVLAEKKQVAIDLFSTEVVRTETSSSSLLEKAVPKEQKTPKKNASESVAEKLQHPKITDLKTSIGINEKFQFINQLFDGNMKEYSTAIDRINGFHNYAEATSYLTSLEEIYKWKEDNFIAGNFKELIKRRFS